MECSFPSFPRSIPQRNGNIFLKNKQIKFPLYIPYNQQSKTSKFAGARKKHKSQIFSFENYTLKKFSNIFRKTHGAGGQRMKDARHQRAYVWERHRVVTQPQ